MKIVHKPEIDFLSLEFKSGIEKKSYFENGVLIREDAKGNVLGIEITDAAQLLLSSQTLSMKEACELLGVSESTMRRRIRDKKIPYTKPNNKDYRFKKKDILKMIA